MYNSINEDDYRFIENENEDFYTVELLSGDFKGVQYQYERVQIKEDENKESASLIFDWSLMEGDPNLREDINFQTYIGDVLLSILESSIARQDYKIGDKDAQSIDSDDNTKKSDNG